MHVMYLLERAGTLDKLDKKIRISVALCQYGVNEINDSFHCYKLQHELHLTQKLKNIDENGLHCSVTSSR
jgi:hypothetical protein